MSNGTLSDTQLMSQQRGNQVALAVVTNDQIWLCLQLCSNFFGDILGESLDVGPHLKARDPLTENSLFGSKGDSENMRVLCSKHFLKTLPAGGSYRIREQSCYNENARNNIKPLLLDPLQHLTLQSRNLVQNVNHLTTGVGIAQNILLSKVTVGRKNDHVENHRDSSKELLESAGVRGLQKVQQHLDHLHDTLCFITPTSLEADLLKLMFKVGVWGCCIECGKVLGRLPQDGLERVEVLDAIIEHHSLALAVVGSEEVEERVHAVLVVEHFSREMPVEELHPVTNRLGEGWPGEGCGEGFKVQFQHEVAPVGPASQSYK
ncbi:hypothetical protein HanRHA438_Chr12g0532421 [Helianthus annuus]|nr:hypothetical protein HanRHA438_Chr12g0532421 [Helianthus annuus]